MLCRQPGVTSASSVSHPLILRNLLTTIFYHINFNLMNAHEQNTHAMKDILTSTVWPFFALRFPHFLAHRTTRLKVSQYGWNDGDGDKRMSEADDDVGPLSQSLHWISRLRHRTGCNLYEWGVFTCKWRSVGDRRQYSAPAIMHLLN